MTTTTKKNKFLITAVVLDNFIEATTASGDYAKTVCRICKKPCVSYPCGVCEYNGDGSEQPEEAQ